MCHVHLAEQLNEAVAELQRFTFIQPYDGGQEAYQWN